MSITCQPPVSPIVSMRARFAGWPVSKISTRTVSPCGTIRSPPSGNCTTTFVRETRSKLAHGASARSSSVRRLQPLANIIATAATPMANAHPIVRRISETGSSDFISTPPMRRATSACNSARNCSESKTSPGVRPSSTAESKSSRSPGSACSISRASCRSSGACSSCRRHCRHSTTSTARYAVPLSVHRAHSGSLQLRSTRATTSIVSTSAAIAASIPLMVMSRLRRRANAFSFCEISGSRLALIGLVGFCKSYRKTTRWPALALGDTRRKCAASNAPVHRRHTADRFPGPPLNAASQTSAAASSGWPMAA